MMRVTKILVSAVAVGVAFVGITATTESRAGDESLVNVSCTGGEVTATAVAPWHTNEAAPWKWDKGTKKEVTKEHATFKGAKCEGTISAFVCNGDQCKGPIKVPVK
jgi:hypothetical protein